MPFPRQALFTWLSDHQNVSFNCCGTVGTPERTNPCFFSFLCPKLRGGWPIHSDTLAACSCHKMTVANQLAELTLGPQLGSTKFPHLISQNCQLQPTGDTET
jgi:hypothetical protein